MYCPKCGTQVTDGSSFCSACGTNLARPPPAYPSNPPYGAAPYSPTYYQQKSGALAIILAFILPGAGHLYAGKIMRGVIFMVAFFGLCIITVFGWVALFPFGAPPTSLIWFTVLMAVVVLILWLVQIIDAYNVTRKYNAELMATGRAPW